MNLLEETEAVMKDKGQPKSRALKELEVALKAWKDRETELMVKRGLK